MNLVQQSDVREIGDRLAGMTARRSDSLATAVRTFEERLAVPMGSTTAILVEGLPNDWSLQPIEVFHLPASGDGNGLVRGEVAWAPSRNRVGG